MSPQPARTTIKICLLDEHQILCQALADLLRQEPHIEVVAACHAAAAALEVCDSQHVDVLLMDLRLDSGDAGFVLLEQIQERKFQGKIVVLAASVEDHDVVRLAGLGVSGMILKDSPPERLVHCVRAVATGQLWFDADQMRRILARLSQDYPPVSGPFTEREREIMRMLLDGASNKEIAGRLGIGVSTAKSLLQTLFRKTGVHTRAQLVRVALEQHREAILA